jgi:internalin A
MTPEEAYQEALLRIRAAERTGALELDLSGLETLNRLPPELERLTSLQSLDLDGCLDLRGDMSPLAGLASLQRLNLFLCVELRDGLDQLAGLTSLQSLNLGVCRQLRGDLIPLAGLASLQSLNLSECEQLSGDLSPLASLTSLQRLDLAELAFCADLSPLAGLTSLKWLDLFRFHNLVGDLSPLRGLTLLQSLDLRSCWQLSGDLSPLTGLTSLQTLRLAACTQLSGDLTPLTGLVSLLSLDLSECGFRRFAPLERLLPTLKYLLLFGCKLDDLPPEVCGETEGENVLDKVCAHYEDLKAGRRIDAEVKVFLLGNGGVGKTQLCRRLRGLEFDDKHVSSTQGIQLSDITLSLEGFAEPVRLNFWDFGGQEIYHGSHALFLHGQAIFLILWTPELECQTAYQEGALSFRHRPLSYWLDYLRAFTGTDASVLIVQSRCDTRDKRILHPPAATDDFPFHRSTEVSSRTNLNLGILKEAPSLFSVGSSN